MSKKLPSGEHHVCDKSGKWTTYRLTGVPTHACLHGKADDIQRTIYQYTEGLITIQECLNRVLVITSEALIEYEDQETSAINASAE